MTTIGRTTGAWASGLVLLLVTTSLATAQAVDPIIDGQALVRLTPAADIGSFNARHGTTTLYSIVSRNIHQIALPTGADPELFQQAAAQDPDVVWVELNYFGQAPEGRGRCFYTLVSLEAHSYLTQPAWGQIDLAGAQQRVGRAGVVVAVIDSGIDATHPALLGAVLSDGWNFVADSPDTSDVGNGLDDDGDELIDEMTGHGTHVAGILRMIAPDAGLLPVKVLDSDGHSTNFLVAAGLFYAIDHGATVLNVSVGSTYDSNAVLDAVLEAQARGIVVVAAGGNMDTRVPEEYPALNPGVIGVAAVDSLDVKSTFSNYHEQFTLSAPGTEIHSTLPGGLYAAWNGTSMATPMVAGVAALILLRHPEWPEDATRVTNIRLALMQSADDIDALNPSYAGLLGAGRLNAGAAVSQLEMLGRAESFDAASAPDAILAAELSGDHLADLATLDPDSGVLAMLVNVGEGTFDSPVLYPAGVNPAALAHGDLDRDGDEDVVLVNDSGVWVLSNDGSGGLSDPVTYAVGAGPMGIAVGDVDHDGALDLAIAISNDDLVRVLGNTGDGAFVLTASVPVGSNPYDVAFADVNRDNYLDLVSVNRDSDDISVALNTGNGTFAAAQHHPVGAGPRAFVVADFDSAGGPDVATANHDSEDLTIAWNDGTGAFIDRTTLALDNGRRPVRLAAGDLDCDFVADLLVTNADETGDSVSVFLNRGDRTFLRSVDYAVSADPQMAVAADVSGDENPDVCVAARGAGAVCVLLSQACPSHRRGDTNCDGLLNTFDIDPFVLALTDAAGYATTYPQCPASNADVNQDGAVNTFDIDPFVEVLTR